MAPLAADAPEIGAAALDGLTRIDCPDARGEALVIALCLREALETPGKRAAVITADRGLARRSNRSCGAGISKSTTPPVSPWHAARAGRSFAWWPIWCRPIWRQWRCWRR